MNEDDCILILLLQIGIIKRICIKQGDLMKTDIKYWKPNATHHGDCCFIQHMMK